MRGGREEGQDKVSYLKGNSLANTVGYFPDGCHGATRGWILDI